MANTYKTVGLTTAKVVSLLAVAGGVLWWARTPSPVDIPRPQDEAELMHACLEREYAMGMTTAKFTHTYNTNFSRIIITNVWSNYIGGTWYEDPAHTGTIFNVYSNLINSAAHTDTNTIGFVPNANQYPDRIRGAIEGAGLGFAPGGPPRYWVAPSNTFMLTGSWDGIFSTFPTWFDGLWNDGGKSVVWTNWVTLSNTVPHQFAFERNTNAFYDLYWSTNYYNDMARALSLMQWQAVQGNTSWKKQYYIENISQFQFGNGYSDTTIWFYVNQYPFPANTTDDYSDWDLTAYGQDNNGWNQGWLIFHMNFQEYITTNPITCFAITNIYAWCNNIILNNGETVGMPPEYLTLLNQSPGWKLNTNELIIPPGKSVSWFSAYSNQSDLITMMSNLVVRLFDNASKLAPGTYYDFNSSQPTNTYPAWYWSTPLPQYSITPSLFTSGDEHYYGTTYRVLFQSLTNYTQHGKAR